MNWLCFSAIAAAALPTILAAQTFPAQTSTLPTQTSCLGCFSTTPVPVRNDDFLFVQRAVAGEGQNGYIVKDLGALPLSAFAGSADVTGLRSETATELRQRSRKAARGAALASASDLIGPVAGKSNRLGGMVSTYEGRTAGAVSFMHQSGAIDVGASMAFAKGGQLAKAGAGFSF